MAMLQALIPALFALGFLIVVHEAGHYVVARWCKMRVERFSVGFGPGILKYRSKKTGTLFQLAPLPFGGFVEIRGMNIAEEVDPDDKEAYANRPAKLRFLTIFAGPATNWISAILLALLLYSVSGIKSTERWFGVGAVTDDAAAAGFLKPGDRVLSINDSPIRLVTDSGVQYPISTVTKIVSSQSGQPVKISVQREGKVLDYNITPKQAFDKEGKPELLDGKPVFRLGFRIAEQHDRRRLGFVDTTRAALRYPVDQTALIMGGLYDVVTGKAKAELGGPVRIVEEFSAAFDSGFVDGIELLMVLSVYLALINLFPLPALDGGRLVFLGYEMITRRRANPKIEATVHMGGVLLLFVVMVMVTYKDIARFF